MGNAMLWAGDRWLVAACSWQDLFTRFPDLEVDVTITDPPYSEHVQANIRSCTTHLGPVRVRQWRPTFMPLAGFEHVSALLEHTRRWVLCFCALEQFGEYLRAAGGQRGAKMPEACYIRSWVWRKHQAAPQLSGDRPANSCEGIAVMHRPGKPRWNGRGQHAWTNLSGAGNPFRDPDTCCEFGRDHNGEKSHECQKPQLLCEHLVAKFSEPGELILDPFCGSGAIVVAALRAGRRVIACDSDPKWAEYTARRCAQLT